LDSAPESAAAAASPTSGVPVAFVRRRRDVVDAWQWLGKQSVTHAFSGPASQREKVAGSIINEEEAAIIDEKEKQKEEEAIGS